MEPAYHQERYRALLDSLPEVVFRTNRIGRFTFLNPAWRSVTGYDVADSLAMTANAMRGDSEECLAAGMDD